MTVSKRAAWKAALEKVAAEVAQQFPVDSRADQVEAALATAVMAIDNLHDYPQYIHPNI